MPGIPWLKPDFVGSKMQATYTTTTRAPLAQSRFYGIVQRARRPKHNTPNRTPLQCEHLVVEENSHKTVQRSRQKVGEFKAREPLEAVRRLLSRHRKDHAVRFPLQAVSNAKLGEHLVDVRVRPEKYVKASLDPVTVFVLPRSHLSPQNISRLNKNVGEAR